MHQDMSTRIHYPHRGTDRRIKAACDTLYWPSIHNDIKYICENCSACQEMEPEQTREPMQSRPIPKRKWQVVSTDLFQVGKDYHVIVADNLTKYYDVEELYETSPENTVLQTKKGFVRKGIPEYVISDNGPQYASKEYKQLTKT